MTHSILFGFIDKRITGKIYQKAREKEKELLPDHFTAYYSRSSVVYCLVLCLFAIFGTVVFGFLNKVVLYILSAASVGGVLLFLYYISYRCSVDDTGVKVKKFWLFEKQVLWEDVQKVEVQKHEPDFKPIEKQCIFRNKQNKVVFACTYDLVGFDLIVKKAKKERKKKH